MLHLKKKVRAVDKVNNVKKTKVSTQIQVTIKNNVWNNKKCYGRWRKVAKM